MQATHAAAGITHFIYIVLINMNTPSKTAEHAISKLRRRYAISKLSTQFGN